MDGAPGRLRRDEESNYSGSLRSAAGAFLHDRRMKPLAQLGRKLVDLMLTIDRDGLPRRIEDNFAVMALANMSLHLDEQVGIDLAVEVVSKLAQEVCAGHGLAPPFFCLK